MRLNLTNTVRVLPGALLAFAVACGDDADSVDEPEVITTVIMDLTDTTNPSNTFTATWSDPDGDGGDEDPTITNPAAMATNTTYSFMLTILNETEPMDSEEFDVTAEIQEEAEEHLFFYTPTGAAITDVTITDQESDYVTDTVSGDLPVGLAGTLTTTTGADATANLNVLLLHLPPIGDTIQKTMNTTENDGEVDFDIDFIVTTQP